MSGTCLLGLGDPAKGIEQLQSALLLLGHEAAPPTELPAYQLRLRAW